VLSHDDLVHPEYTHQSSPRKWRTSGTAVNVITATRGTGYRPSWLYHASSVGGPSMANMDDRPFGDWIGKKIIYWNGESVPGQKPPTFTARIRPDTTAYVRDVTLNRNSTEGLRVAPVLGGASTRHPGAVDDQYIHEYEIARALRPNIYRIVFVDKSGNWRSKVSVDYSEARANILVDPVDTIVGVIFA
jgi:hypothetical protein